MLPATSSLEKSLRADLENSAREALAWVIARVPIDFKSPYFLASFH